MIRNNEILIVVPAYNEEATIAQVITGIHSVGFSCVVIDDGSEDSTSIVAKQAGATVITLPLNVGVGGALRCGFRFAVENKYKAVIQCDADGQHLNHLFFDLISAANDTNADLVLGSRFLSSNNQHHPHGTRRFAMRILALFASRANGGKITDPTSGFRLIRCPLLDELSKHIPEYYLGDTFETLVVVGWAKFKVVEIGTAMSPRQNGESSATTLMSVLQICKSLTRLLTGSHFQILDKT